MDPDVDLSSIMVGYGDAPTAAPMPMVPPPPPVETPMPQPTETVAENNKDLVVKLRLLFDTFPAKLKDIRPKKPLDKLSEDQLLELQKNINYQLGARTNVDAMAKSFPMILQVVEQLAAQFTPLRIQGTHLVCNDPDVQDMIKYTIIDCGLGISSTPQQKLVFKLLSTALQMHVMNTAIESMTPEQKANMAQAMNAAAAKPADDKYADL